MSVDVVMPVTVVLARSHGPGCPSRLSPTQNKPAPRPRAGSCDGHGSGYY